MHHRAWGTLALAVLLVPNAIATVVTVEAFNNATIQPAGPRSGPNGKNFFNIEGSDNGNFSSWGAADFNNADFGISVANPADLIIHGLWLECTQSNASFTKDGPIRIYLVEDATTSIEPGISPFVFLSSDIPEGLGGQFPVKYHLTDGYFTKVANGFVDVFDLYSGLDSATKDVIKGKLISPPTAPFRLVITPLANDTAATWAGFSNSSYAGPTLVVDYSIVPEPSALIALTVGVAGLLARRRRA
ncbi:MAG: PEP-CTERM sorting domain-containing protein [Fimbriimonadia bacterium]|jgi:hypothetical protein